MKEVIKTLDKKARYTLAGLLGLLPTHIKCAHYTSEGVRVFDGGQKYHVFPDGTTVWLASVECSFQLEGCRYPVAWAKWHLWRFFAKSPERLPAVLLAVALAGMGFAWLAICPADQNPFGEWALWVFPMLATGFIFAMNLCLAWLLFLAIVAVTARPVAEMVVDAVREAKAPALPAGEAMLLDMGGLIAPDILVCYDAPDERPDVFADKLLAARRQFGADKYIVAIPFGSDKMVVCCPADADVEFPEEILNVREQMGGVSGDVSAETWQDYTNFLHRAAKPVRNFCTNHRAKTQGAAAALVASLRVALLLLIFAAPAFAQPKTARLKAYLAERATLIVPAQGTEFKASFQLAPIVRKGDGQKNLLELLQSGAAFTDADNAGPLLAVYVGGNLLAPEAQKATPPARASIGAGSAVPVAGEMLDSASTQRRADAIAIAAEREGRKFLGVARIYWNMVIRILDIGFFAFIGIAGLLRFITNVMNNESRLSIHGGTLYGGHFARIGAFTRFWLAMFVVAGLVTLAIAIFARLSIGDIAGVLTMFFCWKSLFVGLWLGVLYLLERVADRIISNPITDARPTDFNQPGGQTRRQIPGQF